MLINSITDLLNFESQLVSVSFMQIIVTLLMSLVLGLFIFIIYKYNFKGVVYSYTFNTTLIMMTIITSIMILAISSNMMLALGMVGALSIVRFRTAIKNPIDVVYLFWAITVGIAVGASLHLLAILGSLFLALVILLLNRFNGELNSYLMVLNCENHLLEHIYSELRNITKYDIKSQLIIGSNSELTLLIKDNKQKEQLVLKVNELDGVNEVSMLKYEE